MAYTEHKFDIYSRAPLDAPTEDQVAQALCMASCASHGFGACTWNGVDACMDADADHFHTDAAKALETWGSP